MADFDVQGARKAGYTDAEIADHLASQRGFDVGAARQSGYKDAEIVDHLSPGPGMIRRGINAVGDAAGTVGNYAATRGANVLGGITADMPAAVAHGADWLYRQAGINPAIIFGEQGAQVLQSLKGASGKQVSGDIQAATGTTPTSLPGGVGKIIDSGVEGAMMAPFSLPLAVGGAVGGALSEAGGQATEGTAAELPVRLGLGFLGGVGGTGAVQAARGAKNVLSAAKKPFTAGGRDEIVGKTMFNVADDPNSAIAKLDAYNIGQDAFPTATPGFRLTTAKAAGDDSLMASENALNRAGAGFGERVNSNNVALTDALNRLDAGMDPKKFVAEIGKLDTGAAMRAQAALDALPPGVDAATAGQRIRDALVTRHDALDTARSNAVNPLYAEARNFPDDLRIGPVFQRVDDAIANSKGDIKKAMEKARGLLFNDKGQPDWSGRGMMNTRTEINDLIGKAVPGSNEQRLLMGIKSEIDNSLSFIPAEQQARQTFAQMSRPLDPFSADQGAKNVAGVLDKAPYTNAPLVTAEKVPSMFFRPGDAGAGTMKEFLAANGGNQGSVDAMKSFIADKARNAKDVKTFLQQNGPAIETLDPALARKLEDAAATKTISQGFKASPAGKFIDHDLDAAVKSTLGAPDSTKRMQSLRMSVGGNPEAVQGLQRAILDEFRRAVGAPVAEGGGTPMLGAAGASKWLEANRGAITNALSPEQVAGLDAITRALKDQAQTAVKVAGSDTSRNLATRSIFEAAVGKYGDAAWLGGVRKMLGWAYGGADEMALERLTQAMLDPRLAAALMKKATPGNVKMAEPLLLQLSKGGGVGALSSPDGRATP